MAHYIFKASDLYRRERSYSFDDVLLVPKKSSIKSRFHTNLESKLTKNKKLKLPFVAANMDTVSEAPMAIAMNQIGAAAILHRFMSIEEQARQIRLVREKSSEESTILAASVGVAEEAKDRSRALVEAGVEILTVDVAHGHSDTVIDFVKYLKREYPSIEVIAGNVATPEGARDLVEAGADAIKVGIGPGSMCTTRIITGAGIPQLTAISLCVAELAGTGVPVIADGGIRASGDAMKALAVGASSIMMGSALSGCLETPGELANGRKLYRGMASRSAQVSWRGGQLPEGMAPEGESTWVPCKGPAAEVIHEFAGGIRSGMSYVNSEKLSDLNEFAYFVEISANTLRENIAHGVQKN